VGMVLGCYSCVIFISKCILLFFFWLKYDYILIMNFGKVPKRKTFLTEFLNITQKLDGSENSVNISISSFCHYQTNEYK